MNLHLVEEEIQRTVAKNAATSYGLTLAIGLPFPAEVCARIQYVQQQLETSLPGRFAWYGMHHLHATLLAPLRGRYRERPPLRREELPADLQRFAHDLAALFSQCPPFPLALAGVSISTAGLVMVHEKTLVRQLSSRLQCYPELDRPKRLTGLHVTIGFLQAPVTSTERSEIERALSQLREVPIGSMTVRRAWLVHYANRTLSRIVGQVSFILGRDNALDAGRLLQELGVIAL
jgi:2'-5' RNA ligase